MVSHELPHISIISYILETRAKAKTARYISSITRGVYNVEVCSVLLFSCYPFIIGVGHFFAHFNDVGV